MFTLPCHKHNPIKVTLKNGEVILARITRFNAETGKVNWIDKGEKWKGTTHCTRVIKATPEEVLAWSKAHEVVAAPLDPCMAGWTLGKTKRGPQMMEGYYFAIGVYKDSKKVGELVDEGYGGPVVTRFKNHADETLFREACRKWCQNCAADGRYADECELFWGWWDEGRTKGIDAKTFNKNEKEQMLKMFGR
jgi:hypothetical protein